eukprot:5242878-Amphidinium_carterae.4
MTAKQVTFKGLSNENLEEMKTCYSSQLRDRDSKSVLKFKQKQINSHHPAKSCYVDDSQWHGVRVIVDMQRGGNSTFNTNGSRGPQRPLQTSFNQCMPFSRHIVKSITVKDTEVKGSTTQNACHQKDKQISRIDAR